MQLTSSQLQSRHKALIEALKRGETVEIIYHGRILGIVHPVVSRPVDSKAQEEAMARFFGMHSDRSTETVEDEMRALRRGRRDSLRDL